MSNLPIYAHRGASAYAMENSYLSFTKAFELGADGLEFDLQLTKDGQLVVTHDIDFVRVAGKRKKVTDLNLEEVKKLRIGRGFWRKWFGDNVLTFEEAIQFANEHNMRLNIELKETLVGQETILSALAIRQYNGLPFHYSSFHVEILKYLKSVNTNCPTAFIGTKKNLSEDFSSLSFADDLHFHKRYYSIELCERANRANKGLRFYGVTGNESFLREPFQDVRGWITDYPDKVREAMNRSFPS
ncbi:glycerophosphodiester phosphodiesterase [Paenisporosarcina cavernae]|uniref:GP-PDE domain-containing protein n=1 Tax=Paenisporosarcina cavernae TaxID=2320858 RepID=A0A385YVE1_9BACL|nr:glycerophosphodiester phosphodiesterase family protein [Paenisporosarcina cavernae]AYC29532.1 hypothetical protein D3873_06400 [Paenisporosarcina cavernae]